MNDRFATNQLLTPGHRNKKMEMGLAIFILDRDQGAGRYRRLRGKRMNFEVP